MRWILSSFVLLLVLVNDATPIHAFQIPQLPRIVWGRRTSRSQSSEAAQVCLNALDQEQCLLAAADVVELPLDVPTIEVSVLIQAAVIVACGYAVAKFKQQFIAQVANRSTDNLGRLTFYDGFLNIIISAIVVRFLFQAFEIDLGPGFQSVFAAGGVGALVFGIASKGLAEQVVGGLVINAWDVFSVGDEIILHECNTEGKVKKIGLVETEIEGYDNIVTKLPNSRIFNQRISNMSNVKLSQVKQTVRFRYSDLPKMPQLLEEIKQEIKATCSPELISDGSRPFRAHLYDYKEDHVQVLVNVHFKVPPNTGPYLDCRQKVLEAIATAVSRHHVEFAIPAVTYLSEDGSKVSAGPLGK